MGGGGGGRGGGCDWGGGGGGGQAMANIPSSSSLTTTVEVSWVPVVNESGKSSISIVNVMFPCKSMLSNKHICSVDGISSSFVESIGISKETIVALKSVLTMKETLRRHG